MSTGTGAVERAYRREAAGVLAARVRHLGDVQLAEDALQEAAISAMSAWSARGVPDDPGAWLAVAARRRAIDMLRRERVRRGTMAALAGLIALERQAGEGDGDPGLGADPLADDRLRLVFTCCHPALATEARVALTLRLVGGLTTAEVARAFLVPEPTMAQRLVRAKRKIRDAGIPFRVPGPEDRPERLAGVLAVVYLVFNEGYQASGGDRLTRGELAAEAIRLGELLAELMPGEPEVLGLLALMRLHDARRAARVDAAGGYVPLERQDRARWYRHAIAQGLAELDRALALRRPGGYQLQAAVAALHAEAPDWASTDWHQIAALYHELTRRERSPVVAVNHAVAAGLARGPHEGLRLLAPLLHDPRLAAYQPLHAAHAALLEQGGQTARARAAYERAIALSGNAVERAELERRLAALGAAGTP